MALSIAVLRTLLGVLVALAVLLVLSWLILWRKTRAYHNERLIMQNSEPKPTRRARTSSPLSHRAASSAPSSRPEPLQIQARSSNSLTIPLPQRPSTSLSVINGGKALDETKAGRETKNLTDEEKFSRLYAHLKENRELVNEYIRRVNAIELVLTTKPHLANKEMNKSIIASRRILGEIKKRSDALDQLLQQNSNTSLDTAMELSLQPLEFRSNAVDSLLDAENLPPLAPQDWRDSLEKHYAIMEQLGQKLANF